jgi:predicted flap endonuclease-1-like 5' DNA nuclease
MFLNDRETRGAFAVIFATAAALVGINAAVNAEGLPAWASVAGLICAALAVGLWVWSWRAGHAEASTDDADAEPVVTAPAAALPQPEPPAPPVPLDPTPAAEVEAVSAAADPAPAAEVEAVPDDLTRIEGIGPYYRDALHKLGITSFAQLAAQTDAEALVTLLKSNGYRQHPSIPTWAEQAALAAAGDWEALTALQATLSGGRRSGD